mgnify:FL=1
MATVKDKKKLIITFVCAAVGVLVVLGLICVLIFSLNSSNPIGGVSAGYEYKIDKEFYQKEKNAKSNAELTNLNIEYSAKWEEKIELYYQLLEDEFDKKGNTDMVMAIKESANQWKSYYSKQQDLYDKIVNSQYGSGSIVPIAESNYYRKLSRSKAVELYKLCRGCMIQVEEL